MKNVKISFKKLGENILEKIAIIDIKSTKIDMLVAEYNELGNYSILDDYSEQVKIIEDYSGEGLLRLSRSQEALKIIKMYKIICEVEKIDNIVVYGSHSLKNLKNYRSFVDEIYNSVGLKVKILNEEEELVALYGGIVNSLDVPKGVAVYIGGASTKLVEYNRRTVLNQTILPCGTYQMAEIFDAEKDVKSACDKIVEKYKEELAQVEWLKEVSEEFLLVGTGNAFLNVGSLSRKIKKYPLDLAHAYCFSKENMDSVYNLLVTLEIDKTKKIKGVSSDRADIFASGTCMIKALMEMGNFGSCTVSTKGAKEGRLFSLVNPITNEKPITDLIGYSLENCAILNYKEVDNRKQVGELALLLFRQLKVLHKLPRAYVKVLKIASLLHDSGRRVQFYNNEKNSFEVVLNSEVFGVTHREIALASFVACCQNPNNFNLTEWIKYKDLFVEEDLDAMRKLALIVRLAVALDKTKRSVVQDISCDILGDSVIMKTIVTMNAEIEIKEALKVANDFKKVYKKTLEVL